MALTHPLLLLGLVLTGIPVVLHLMLRARPKKLIFPALRLIQTRRRQNVQRLRLRHILLLVLRILVIALLVFAVTRPKIPAGDYSPTMLDLMRFGLVLAGVATAYALLSIWWRRQAWPKHVLRHRQTLLQYGLGTLGLFLLLGVAAWPYARRVAASIADPQIRAGLDVPVAAVFLFDTSLSMEYRQENKTRLDLAREIAERHLAGFPSGSRAAIADSASDAPIRLQSVAAARARLSQVENRPDSRSLNDRLEAALQALLDDRQKLSEGSASGDASEQFAREVYVFTDLAATAWRLGESPRLAQLFEQLPGAHVYVIDVGVPEPQNLALTNLSLSNQTPALGSELAVRATLEGSGLPAGDRVVQIYFENEDGKLVDKGKSTLKVEPGQPVQVAFSLRDLSGSVRQGELRLSASDPLAFDDVLRFSVLVQSPPKVLVVSDRRESARFVSAALAAEERVRLGKANYQCKIVAPAQLSNERLKDYAAVWLVNVENPAAHWKALADYVQQGGGLGVILGHRVTRDAQPNYLTPEALSLLPGLLASDRRPAVDDVFLDLHDLTHPIQARFQDWGVVELTSVPIHRYWVVDADDVKETRVIARFTSGRSHPALMTRPVGKGQVLLLATAVDSPASTGKNSWNDLPTIGWKYVAWVDQMTKFLSQSKAEVWNHAAGAEIRVPLPETPPLQRYLLRKPNREQIPGDAPASGRRPDGAEPAKSLTFRGLDQLGNYRVIATEPKFERGFSINSDPAESQLRRLSDAEMAALLPKGRYSVARSVESLDRKVRDGRIGREIYPLIVFFLAAVFVGEQFVANWFYGGRRESGGRTVKP